jgi:lysozyme-like protein
MPVISDVAIAQAAVQGGLAVPADQETLAKWVAVALAETLPPGNTDSANNVGAGHTGLWQISGLHAGRVPGSPVFPSAFRAWLKDPVNNARAAKYVYDAQGWGAWEVILNNRYRQFMDRGRRAAAELVAEAVSGGPHGLGTGGIFGSGVGPDIEIEPLEQVAEAIRDAIRVAVDAAGWLSDRKNWGRIGIAIVGVGAITVAVATLSRPLLEPAAQTAMAAKGART